MCIALSSRDRHPPTSRDCVSGWLCSGAAAGGRGTGQGLYCQEINHITRKQKHGWFFDCWMTSLTVTDTAEAVTHSGHLLHFVSVPQINREWKM